MMMKSLISPTTCSCSPLPQGARSGLLRLLRHQAGAVRRLVAAPDLRHATVGVPVAFDLLPGACTT